MNRLVTMNPITSALVTAFMLAGLAIGYFESPYAAVACFVAAALIATSLKMANTWQKLVILRMGKLQSVKGALLLGAGWWSAPRDLTIPFHAHQRKTKTPSFDVPLPRLFGQVHLHGRDRHVEHRSLLGIAENLSTETGDNLAVSSAPVVAQR